MMGNQEIRDRGDFREMASRLDWLGSSDVGRRLLENTRIKGLALPACFQGAESSQIVEASREGEKPQAAPIAGSATAPKPRILIQIDVSRCDYVASLPAPFSARFNAGASGEDERGAFRGRGRAYIEWRIGS
ncbi:hypothetical protein KM043_008359 [Ampulex compressa]|nr:hypothetical protein KM043_008359 [Ampulex compressa]